MHRHWDGIVGRTMRSGPAAPKGPALFLARSGCCLDRVAGAGWCGEGGHRTKHARLCVQQTFLFEPGVV